MTLKEWLERNGRQHAWLARTLGVTQQTVYNYVHGRSTPRPRTRMLIEILSGGDVTESDWPGVRATGPTHLDYDRPGGLRPARPLRVRSGRRADQITGPATRRHEYAGSGLPRAPRPVPAAEEWY